MDGFFKINIIIIIMNTQKIINELKPIDYFIEKSKITLLFNDNKILMLNDLNDNFMYSFFIDRNLIASDITDENEFITNFKKYLEVAT
jgi:hypothetical protein